MCINTFIKKLLIFVLRVVWGPLTVTNEDVIHYLSELLFNITLASPGQKGHGPCLGNKWKCNKKSCATVVHGGVATSSFDS